MKPTKVEYTNKRGQVVQVWKWTLKPQTTRYLENGQAMYVRESKKV